MLLVEIKESILLAISHVASMCPSDICEIVKGNLTANRALVPKADVARPWIVLLFHCFA